MLRILCKQLYFWGHKSIKMNNIILFGPPGSGKGTQAVKLAEALNLCHISTGDLLRSEKAAGTQLGLEAKSYMDKGELVPDSVVIGMIGNKLDELANKVDGFIFDGFPRTAPQAEALDNLLEEKTTKIAKVLALEVTEEEIVKRILARGETSGRADDNDEATIRNRFQVYLNQTAPLAEYYKGQNKFVSIKGEGSIDDIFAALQQAVSN